MNIINLDTSPISDIDIEDEKEDEKEDNHTLKYPDTKTQSQNKNKTNTKLNTKSYSIYSSIQNSIYVRIISKISYRSPFIKELLEFNIEENYIKFNGYYHVENANVKTENHGFNILPQIVIIIHKDLDNHRHYYLSEIYHKEVIKDTSEYTYDQDEDLKICCFPTGIIVLKFNILEKIDNLDLARSKLSF